MLIPRVRIRSKRRSSLTYDSNRTELTRRALEAKITSTFDLALSRHLDEVLVAEELVRGGAR